jgi:DnaK suppressor protein
MGTTHAIDNERVAVLRRMLEERRLELQDKMRSIREEVPAQADEVRDAEEQSVTDFAREMDFALMEMKAQTLVRIDEALRRVDEGTYGTCVECEQDIAAARLKALPFAVRCVECQARAEDAAAEDREPGPVRALAPIA